MRARQSASRLEMTDILLTCSKLCNCLSTLTAINLKVRTMVAALAEKLATSSFSLDAQAISNALYGKKHTAYIFSTCQFIEISFISSDQLAQIMLGRGLSQSVSAKPLSPTNTPFCCVLKLCEVYSHIVRTTASCCHKHCAILLLFFERSRICVEDRLCNCITFQREQSP
jgi:hypothetical protein